MANTVTTATTAELRASYEDFLRSERFGLSERIATAVDDYAHQARQHLDSNGSASTVGWGCPRVQISMSELRSENPAMSQQLRHDPLRHLRALEAACHSVASEERPGYDKENVRIKVALAGPVGAQPLSPRGLTAASLKQLVCVEGVATKVSTIKPKVVESVHYCPETRQHDSRTYVDATDPALGLHALDAAGHELPDRIVHITSSVYPTRDKDGNQTETEFGLSTFKDHQTITLQEMPERAPMGQLPRSVELILDHDLVDRVKPGDRVQIVGVFRALAKTANGPSAVPVFRTVLLVNNIQILGRDSNQLTFSPQDIRSIRALAKRRDILQILGRSIAPSIHGHGEIKKALVLQQLSGCEKNLENGTHLRGDINLLMVGDPSTAKSQLLRSAMAIAPLAVSTTGKGSSGVGLTAAVTSDPDTRERRLEAGAMVLADRGLVCVDEFDKMGENDRVAIHEAMEQQTVTIAKAGIHASLNARCSVLAAANPVYGQYDRKRRIQENIGLPDSLLSRFDLLFVVLDQLDPETDRKIATHVIRGHRYRKPGSGGRMAMLNDDFDDYDDLDDNDEGNEEGGVWQRSQNTGDYALTQAHDDSDEKEDEHDPHATDILQHDFLRKFLHFAKARMNPVLTDGARECIANRYAEMRSRQDERRTLPVTARSLETIIRLATAHAKARLSSVVEAEPDVAAAMSILGFALYHEQDEMTSTIKGTGKRVGVEVTDDDADEDEESDDQSRSPKKQRLESSDNDTAAKHALKAQIWDAISSNGGDMSLDQLCGTIEEANRDEIERGVQDLVSESKLMLDEDDGMIYQS